MGESLVQMLGEVEDPDIGGPGCQGGGDGSQGVLRTGRGHSCQDVQCPMAEVEGLVEVERLAGGGGDRGEPQPDRTGMDVGGDDAGPVRDFKTARLEACA